MRINEQKPLDANILQGGAEREKRAAADAGRANVVEARRLQRIDGPWNIRGAFFVMNDGERSFRQPIRIADA